MIKKLRLADQEYFFEQWIFRAGFIVLFIIFLALYLTMQNENIHVKCPKNSVSLCENPLFNNSRYATLLGRNAYLINEPTLPVGFEIGKEPFIVRHFGLIMFLIILDCFVFNHAIYNKSFDFKKFWKNLKKELNKQE